MRGGPSGAVCDMMSGDRARKLTINIPGDRFISASTTAETAAPNRPETARLRSSGGGSEDHISVSSATSNIQSALDNLAVGRGARVSRLAQLYSSGRYAADSQDTAKGLIAGAESVKIR